MTDFATLGMRIDTKPLDDAADSLNEFAVSGKKASDSAESLEKSSGTMGKAVGRASDSVMRMARAAAAMAAVAAPAALFGGALREAQFFETQMLRVEGVIRATGGAAGRSADQLREQARELARATLASTEGVLQAQTTLLTFRNVQGDVFDRAITSANDLSAALGTDLNSATLQLAKALEDPTTGITALTRSGTVFTEAQKDVIKSLVETGDIAKAQTLILDELEAQYGGTAVAAAQGLAGAQDGLGQSFQELKLAIADTFNLLAGATSVVSTVDAALQFLAENMDRVRAYTIAAAGALTAYFIPGLVSMTSAFVAAKVAAMSFAGALAFVRRALIATGIGALVIAAGELIHQFTRLVDATGSIGAAFKALRDVGVAVWDGIATAAEALPLKLSAIWQEIRAGFFGLLADLKGAWESFLLEMQQGAAQAGMSDLSGRLLEVVGQVNATKVSLEGQAKAARAAADSFNELAKASVNAGAQKVRDGMNQLVDVVVSVGANTEDGASAAERLSAALGEDELTGSAGGASKALKEASEEAENLGDTLVSVIDSASGHWGDFIADGFRDWSSFMDGLKSTFTSTLSDIIATATKNQIMLSVGLDTGSVTSAGGSGGLLSSLLGGASGLSGLLGGIGSVASGIGTGLMGIFSGGGLASSFANLGGLLSGTVAGLGAIGAALPALGLVVAAIGLFTSKTKLLDQGLRITIDDMDTLVEQFDKVQKSSFFGLIKSTSTNYRAATDDIADPITAAVSDIQTSVLSASDALGIAASTYSDFATEITVSTHGMSEDEAAEAVAEALTGVADEMAVLALAGHEVLLEAESASDALFRLSTDLIVVNEALEATNRAIFETSIEAAAAASEIATALGGSESFASVFAGYLTAFYTEAERTALLVGDLEDAFAELGLTMPETRAGFRALVDGVDLTTEAGRALYAELLSLSSAMDEVLPSVMSLSSALFGMVTDINSDIAEQISSAESAARESARAAELWYQTSETLQDFLADLTGSDLGGLDPFEQASANAALYESTLAAAMGGDQSAAADFTNIARQYLDSALATASSRQEYEMLAAQVMGDTQLLSGVSTLEGSIMDVTEDLLLEQISILESLAAFLTMEDLTDEQLAALSDELQDYVANWDDTILTFDQALAGIESAIAAVGDMSYDTLKEGMSLTIDMIAQADDLPAEVRQLLLGAVDGVGVSIDFILRQNLPPDLLFLAVNAESEHLKSIELLLTRNDLTTEEMMLALETSGQITRTLQLLLSSDTDPDVLLVALAGVSELGRVVNLYLDPSVDPDLMTLALQNIHDYLVVMQASLDPGVPDDIRRLALEESGIFALVVEVALDLPPDEATLLLDSASLHTRNVLMAMQFDGLSTAEIETLMNASRDALLTVTISLVYPSQFTPEEIAMMQDDATSTLRTIYASLYYFSGITQSELDLLQTSASDAIMTIEAQLKYAANLTPSELEMLASGGIDVDLSVLGQLGYSGLTNKEIKLLESGNMDAFVDIYAALSYLNLTPEELDLLLLDETATYHQIFAALTYLNLTPEEQDMLLANGLTYHEILASLDYLGVSNAELDLLLQDQTLATRLIQADVKLSASALDKDFMAILTDYSDKTQRTINGLLDLETLTAEEKDFLEAVTGASNGKITLSGGVSLDPSKAFQIWYEDTTTSLMLEPMDDLRASLDDLRTVMQGVYDMQALTLAQANLEIAYNAQQAMVPDAQSIVDQIEALEASTGVTLWDDDKNQNAYIGVNDYGKIVYNFDSLMYSNQSDLDAFRDEWAVLKAEMDAYNAEFLDYNSTINGLRNQITALGGIPAFAEGGFHSGGLRVVGEYGPELEATGPSRIYSNSDTTSMLRDAMNGPGYKELCEEVKKLRDALQGPAEETAYNTRKIRDEVEDLGGGEYEIST